MFGINQPLLDFFLFVFTVSAFHGMYLAFVGMIRFRKDKSKLFFSFIVLIFSGLMLAYILVLNKTVLDFPIFYGFIIPYLYLLGPLYLIFVYYQSKQSAFFKAVNLIHFLPFFYFLWDWINFLNLDLSYRLNLIQNFYTQSNIVEFSDVLISHLPYFHFLIYLIIAQKIIINTIPIQTKVLRMTAILRFLLLVFIFLPYLTMLLAWSAAIYEMILLLFLTVFIHYCAYQLLFSKDFNKTSKYKSSPLSFDEMTSIQNKIEDIMHSEKLYLKQDFKISDLSKAIDYPVHHISQVLGEMMHINFSSLINRYRIEEITERLIDDQFAHYSFFAIAQDCGFKNKSNFHRVFKKELKMTPKEFFELKKTL